MTVTTFKARDDITCELYIESTDVIFNFIVLLHTIQKNHKLTTTELDQLNQVVPAGAKLIEQVSKQVSNHNLRKLKIS